MTTCYTCKEPFDGDVWEPGQCCVFGTIFACCRACAEAAVLELTGRKAVNGDIVEEARSAITPK